ncbi:MAG TPA: endonuclease/exonuclease/phosphatase [Rhodoferax sp.]|uniref:endonuclease/exonuclease/phosphatase family protein n=1 Tax=Rhodoferax sp. TaxID=50421 RepID=UPI0008BABD2E|nr:endonuclease/exonuclease/phosphatase family protein [Rhodoferax sp.]OGP00232.1 MAG: endonuclease/exonuclease/phosphatase [Curvibacter sp. GWA2_63_95]HCX82788.1 endonuclease/exonuclease/phosphatase [Rhodoferax sp.]
MRLATFNVENMFDRAKALNGKNWAEGKPALEAQKELNALFEKPSYSVSDKKKMLKLLTDNGLLKTDDSPLLLLRKIRGQLIKRPRVGDAEIVASGRKSWIGWVELKTEPVNETATLNTARVLHAMAADVQAVIEAEDRTTLRLFNAQVIKDIGGRPFDHVMLVDGNDERGIDVGLMTKSKYPILSIRSHVDDTDTKGAIFSRDCAEYEIELSKGKRLWVLVNHFKSKGYGSQAANDAKRKRQAQRVRELYDAHLQAGDSLVAVVGDLNEIPGNGPMDPLLRQGSTLRDISSHPKFDSGGKAGTHGNCGPSAKLDYILLSPNLYSKVTAAGVERRGMWGGVNGTLWPHFEEVGNADEAASDHAALWVDLDI